MTDSNFPFNDADGRAVTIQFDADQYDLPPTASNLDGTTGRVIETTTKHAGPIEVDAANVQLGGETYVVLQHDDENVKLYAEGREIIIPNSAIHVGG